MSSEPPFGAMVVVYRRRDDGVEYLVLHRGHVAGPGYEGDWAWGPPGGLREVGESIDTCACRELDEETGLNLRLRRVPHPDGDWAVYLADTEPDAAITISNEHDRFQWLPAAEALQLVSPAIIRVELTSAVHALEGGR